MAFPKLRARGGRNPQLEDGTFEGVVAPADDPKPSPFTVIAWAPGAFPGIELWCYRERGGGATWSQIPANSDPVTAPTLYLDKVTSGEFVPPVGQQYDSNATLQALRQYASARWLDAYSAGTDDAGNWSVSVVRPFMYLPPGTEDTKIDKDEIYIVSQVPASGGSEVPTAWIWVPVDSVTGQAVGREIWLLHLPGEAGGFSVPGSVPAMTGVPFNATRFKFVQDMKPGDYGRWSLDHYANTIDRFKQHVLATSGFVVEAADLVVLDHRCSNPVP